MDIVHTMREPSEPRVPSVFLAGPTRANTDSRPSWRPAAIRELQNAGFDGTVFVPETAPDALWPSPVEQLRWEHTWLDRATRILFWVPRDMDSLPAMTTNIEFGMYMRTGKIVVGAPPDAPHMRSWMSAAEMYNIPFAFDISSTAAALMYSLAAAERTQGTGRILARPLAYRGRFVRVENTKYLNRLGEVRWYETVRRNTFGDVVSVFALTREREVVLIKSYRVPHDAWVVEKPAGLADKRGEDAAELAARELDEETGYGGGTPLQLVLRGPFDAGLNDDVMSVFFTRNVVKLHEPRLEPAEDIQTVLVPLDELVEFVEHPPEGVKPDMKLLAPLPILQTRGLLA